MSREKSENYTNELFFPCKLIRARFENVDHKFSCFNIDPRNSEFFLFKLLLLNKILIRLDLISKKFTKECPKVISYPLYSYIYRHNKYICHLIV